MQFQAGGWKATTPSTQDRGSGTTTPPHVFSAWLRNNAAFSHSIVRRSWHPCFQGAVDASRIPVHCSGDEGSKHLWVAVLLSLSGNKYTSSACPSSVRHFAFGSSYLSNILLCSICSILFQVVLTITQITRDPCSERETRFGCSLLYPSLSTLHLWVGLPLPLNFTTFLAA